MTNNKQLTTKDFFFCYNPSLMSYLLEQGLRFITCARHERTNDKFWMFQQSEKLTDALKEYKNKN